MQYYIKVALEHLGYGLIIPISISWKLANGLSVAEAAATEALILLCTALFEIPSGMLADKIGNRKSLLLGAFLQTAAIILLAIGGGLPIFIISAVLSGVAWACISGADEAYIYQSLVAGGKAYKRFFANVTIVDEVATVVGMLGSSLLLMCLSLQWPFIIAATVLAVHLLYALIALPKDTAPVKTRTVMKGTAVRQRIFRTTLRLAPLLIALAVVFEAGRALWQPRLEGLGVTVGTFGIFFVLFKLAGIGGALAAKHRELTSRTVGVSFGIMLLSLGMIAYNNKLSALVGLALFMASENYFRIYMSSVLNDIITSHRATMLSIASSFRNVIGSGIIFGLGYVATSSMQIAFTLLLLIKLPAMAYLVWHFVQARPDNSARIPEEQSF